MDSRRCSSSLSRSSCRLINDVHSAAATGCKGMKGLPNLSFSCRSDSQTSSVKSMFLQVPSSSDSPRVSDDSFSRKSSYTGSCDADEFDSSYHNYSRTSHMGVLDPNYTVFVSRMGNGSLIYRIHAGVAVIAGDPLCKTTQVKDLINEFKDFHKDHRLKVIHIGASPAFAEYAQEKGCVTMSFGRERVLNPMTNPLLQNKAGKRTISQCRQLLDPTRGGISVGVYAPGISGCDPALEAEIQAVYDDWRGVRDGVDKAKYSQAFITQYDLFSRPDITMVLYTWGTDGRVNGIAGLRCLGANQGFQLDPCIASDDAPRGVGDLLVILSMQLLKKAGVSYLSLGFEPYGDLQDLAGQEGLWAHLTKDGYRRVMKGIHVDGKKAYNDRFRPDDEQASNLYIVMPKGIFHIRESIALMRTANINLGRIFA